MAKNETYQIETEYTDTFGGEANYCWVRRATIDIPCGASLRTITKRIRSALGLTGLRGRWKVNGDTWDFRPYGMCTIAMARVVY